MKKYLFLLFTVLTVSSCGYYNNLFSSITSRGTEPKEKTYRLCLKEDNPYPTIYLECNVADEIVTGTYSYSYNSQYGNLMGTISSFQKTNAFAHAYASGNNVTASTNVVGKSSSTTSASTNVNSFGVASSSQLVEFAVMREVTLPVFRSVASNQAIRYFYHKNAIKLLKSEINCYLCA